MKRVLLLSIAAGLVATTFSADADAQQRRRRRSSSAQMNAATGPGDSTYYYKGRNGRYGKTMNEATTGVPGKDTVKMNTKGQHRNLNQNSGQPLPPNNGKVGGL